MKSICILILTLLSLLDIPEVFATAQFQEILLIKNDTFGIKSLPLESYFDIKGDRSLLEIDSSRICQSTALHRGYISTWMLENDSIFLVRVETYNSNCNLIDIDISKEFGTNKVFAYWVNDVVCRPAGRLLQYSYFGPIHEESICYTFENGLLIDTESKNNVEFDPNSVFPSDQDIEDTIRQLILKSLDKYERSNFGENNSCDIYIRFNDHRLISLISLENKVAPKTLMEKIILKNAIEALKDFPPLMKVNQDQYFPPTIVLHFIGDSLKYQFDSNIVKDDGNNNVGYDGKNAIAPPTNPNQSMLTSILAIFCLAVLFIIVYFINIKLLRKIILWIFVLVSLWWMCFAIFYGTLTWSPPQPTYYKEAFSIQGLFKGLFETIWSIFIALLLLIKNLILVIPAKLYVLPWPREIKDFIIFAVGIGSLNWILTFAERTALAKRIKLEADEKTRKDKEEKEIREAELKKEREVREENLRFERENRESQLRKEKEIDRRKNIVLDLIDIYKDTAREVNKTLIPTLITELYDIYAGLHSDNLREIIINGSLKDFQNIINAIKSELIRIKDLALYAQSRGFTDEERYTDSNDNNSMTKEKAFEIFGVKATATKDELKKAYRDLAKKFNTDQRGNLEDHIKKMLEEKMKELNNARDYLLNLGLI